jgi:hypothetical protein
MSCCSALRSCVAGTLMLAASLPAFAEGRGYFLGAGVDVDSADGLAGNALASLQLADRTWLSGSVARTNVELPRGLVARTWYADVGLDHQFDPVGIRLGIAYWGDNDFFDSLDLRGSLYVRGERGSLSLDLEHRDFELDLPPTDFRPGRDVGFAAVGAGLSMRYGLSENLDVIASGMSYDYDVPLRIEESDRLLSLLSISRLSLLSSLIDWRVSAGLGIDVGPSRLTFDVGRWQGSVDGSDNFSATVGFLTPLSLRTDVEVRLGFDDSDLYGDVTVLSVFLYFYGGE